MSTEKIDGIFNLTAPVVMSHPHLFEARAFGPKGKESGTPKFSANLVMDPTDAAQKADIDGMKARAVQIARARWPGRDLKELQFPFSNGTKAADKRKNLGKSDGEFQRGKVVIATRSKYEPRLAVVEGGRILDLEGANRLAHKSKFYFGCLVLAEVNFQAYDGVGKNPDGVNAYLNIIVSLNKGARLSGGPTASEAFKGYVGAASAEDPTESTGGMGLDDDITF